MVCATCAGAGDDERLQTYRYKMVIIDEATQATEPSNLIPLVNPAHSIIFSHPFGQSRPVNEEKPYAQAVETGQAHRVMSVVSPVLQAHLRRSFDHQQLLLKGLFLRAIPQSTVVRGTPQAQVRGAECVVMAGDPKQLPPTLVSDGALDAQMDRTLFDRLQDSGTPPRDSRKPSAAQTTAYLRTWR